MAKKSKKEKEQNTDGISSGMDFASKILKPLKILFEIHLKLALRELKKDTGRFFSGLLSYFLGLFFITVFYLLVNVLAILLLNKLFEPMFSVLITAGCNLFLAVLFISAGKNNFKKPFFSDTKKIIEDTMKEIKK